MTDKEIKEKVEAAAQRAKSISLVSDIDICNNGDSADMEFRLSDADDRDRDITWKSEERFMEELKKEFSRVTFHAGDKGFCSLYVVTYG